MTWFGHYITIHYMVHYTGSVSHHYQYSTVAQAMPGEASPYSVSSELYKHVLPGYFSHTTNSRAGSVLV